MICECCLEDKKYKDFLNNGTKCYQCIYNDKISKNNNERETHFCRECKNEFISSIKHRTVYCCRDCAIEGHKKQNKKHWTKELRQRLFLEF